MRGVGVDSIPADEQNLSLNYNNPKEGNTRQSIFQNKSISSSDHIKRANIEEGNATDLQFDHSDSNEDKIDDISVDDEEIKQYSNPNSDEKLERFNYLTSRG